MEYDEDRELSRYVCEHYQHLMTEFERQVFRAIVGRAKADSAEDRRMAEVISRKWGELGVPEVEAALADGVETFRGRVRDRLLFEAASAVFVNRCPKCTRVVRTPKARQCFWCGFDWHEQDAEVT